ncbi:hypothetical protein Q1J61_00575 [Pseudomonas putida]|uniref:hypothetical protein n=1 Tax=Pseudomonas putida TaxID=303 RepID=UPI0034D5D894
MPSLKSQMRGKLASVHGKRTNTRNNLWICFSPKLDKDISLASNNELIYWISTLEVEPSIRSFEFGVMVNIRVGDAQEFRSIELIKVVQRDGKEEFHHISSSSKNDSVSEIDFMTSNGEIGSISYRAVSEDYIALNSKRAATLLSVLPFVAQMRGKAWRFEEENILNIMKMLRSGTIGNLIEQCNEYDAMIVVGLLVKFALQGKVELHELVPKGLKRATRWSLN